MSLLSEMEPLRTFELDGATRNELAQEPIPKWLSGVGDRGTALTLLHYARSGSARRRLLALSKAAAILARLHAAGLVYGDVSPTNCFMSTDSSTDLWLIDADNLRFELVQGGSSVYTPRYGAPEIVQGLDRSRPRTDCWAFAVMTFEVLSLVHPFVGQKVLEAEEDASGWDAEPATKGAPVDLDEQAFAGILPFVDDEDDRSNPALSGLPRTLVLTPQVARLFQETFGIGRTAPWCRPAMAFWALELARAHDRSIVCADCAMSYLVDRASCPYCDAPRSEVAIATTGRWQKALQPSSAGIATSDLGASQ
jgi:DNA-binding helix-hairpin-helix protein with protein kinase domain